MRPPNSFAVEQSFRFVFKFVRENVNYWVGELVGVPGNHVQIDDNE